ncbi:MAG: hypothetical protein JRH16_09475 [Deltaproteobacteria bacterium]|nr:hypothetical protein [Deltaproteobacteria bacterium]MBW2362790.1 hypothetical protein [Deltaproteobacteria bacterium]
MDDANGVERTEQLEKALLSSLEALERGDVEAAREELMRVAPATPLEPLAPGLSDRELDAAFADAEPEQECMLDADGVAQAAIAQADRALADADAEPLAHEVGEHFATATMAALLEQQGDTTAASQIRAALAETPAAAESWEPPRPSREHVIRTLETWLENLREGARG